MLFDRAYPQSFLFIALCLISSFSRSSCDSLAGKHFNKETLGIYRNKVKDMFYHAYDNYIFHAYPYDELHPITCQGFDTWGSYSLTLVDSLDMLIILGNRTEFERVVELVLKNIDLNKDINVSVFETNIRIIGGLVSAHLLSYRLYLEKDTNVLKTGEHLDPNWPCDGKLLRLAVQVAQKILPAFDTKTGMPYGTVNLKYGVPKGETMETCVAGVGTFIMEFATLSRLTGDPIYEEVASRAMDSLWERRSEINLIGNHINVGSGRWTGVDATIGSGVDSYYEYLVKAGILLNRPEFIKQFKVLQRSIDKFMFHEGFFVWANMDKGQKTLPLFSSLEAFYPGLLTLTGDMEQAIKLTNNYHKIWRKFGSLPEFYNINTNSIHAKRESYPLRPELIESLMYLIRSTNNDEAYYEMAVDYLHAIEHIAKLDCGFATVKDVKDHRLENRMESFFLAETLKYLYLIFDEKNFLHNDLSLDSHKIIENNLGECVIETGYFFFNTEAHPIDGASLECCRVLKSSDAAAKDTNSPFPKSLNLTRLIDRHLELNSKRSSADSRSMEDDYNKLKKQEEMEQLTKDSLRLNLCARISNTSLHKEFIMESMELYTNTESPFSCSLENNFATQMSFINNQNYFP